MRQIYSGVEKKECEMISTKSASNYEVTIM